MNLNKYEAVNEHRKMWAWILEEVKRSFENRDYDIRICKLKQMYLEQTYPYDKVYNDCFICDYAQNNSNKNLRCNKCLLVWGKQTELVCPCAHDRTSPYRNLMIVDTRKLGIDPYLRYQVLKWIEEMINLPVREDV